MKTLDIKVKVEGGKVAQTIETSGFTGGECKNASAPFEKIGGATVSDEMTAEGNGGACNYVPAAQG